MSRRLCGSTLIGCVLIGMSALPASALSSPASSSAAVAAPTITTAQFESRVLARINERRVRIGCGALRNNTALKLAARRHNAAMIRVGDLSHQLAGEPGLVSRIVVAGYKPWRELAENLAWGGQTPGETFWMWMHSAPHRRNLQDCALHDAGVSVGYSHNRPWVTIDFGRH
ncbi:MAG: hypothetical protein JWQ32_2408 [Marmoricola sp.]|nr:hypothetical protein [Marmoricola sp.]